MARADRLKKELNLFNIYAIATGSTISSGFFLLPGIAAAGAGGWTPLTYIIAALPLIPGIFCMMELATAMPRAGGIYYFLDRSMGPLIGTIGGLGVWLVVVLKAVFALMGVGVYLDLYVSDIPLKALTIALAVFFGMINLLGARKTGVFQSVLVVILLGILGWFCAIGIPRIEMRHFYDAGAVAPREVFATAGLLCVSYIGLTKVASVAEEVKNPERNLPLGVFLGLITALVLYFVGSSVIFGVVPLAQLSADLTPAASAAGILSGNAGRVLVTVAAILAFASVANAGILSASRYPLAMSRDAILPAVFRKLGRDQIPGNAILLTVVLIIIFILLLDVQKVAKLASAFQLLMFAMTCLAVIVMRESHIESYDPGYRAPLYPYLHLTGILLPMWFIYEMGFFAISFSLLLVVLGVFWYYRFARAKITRGGAIYHIFARLGERKYEGLDRELREILREKGLRKEDPFDRMIARARVIQTGERDLDFADCAVIAADHLSRDFGYDSTELFERFLASARGGSAPLIQHVALPHVRLADINDPEIVIIHSERGIDMRIMREFWGDDFDPQPVYGLLFMLGPENNPRQHLRLLAQVTECVDHPDFLNIWLAADTEQEIKEVLLRDEHFLSLNLQSGAATGTLIGQELRAVDWPASALVAMIHREGQLIIPHGQTVLESNDRLTIIGESRDIQQIKVRFRLT
ncbi:MAG: amino acid permease [Leptospiraceae bacterium]|nr:amino acid permease [Leptospiraceae bacterium]